MSLSNYIPICEAIVKLMEPLVEVAIHDIDSNKIAYINGNISKRKINDLSLLSAPTSEELDRLGQITYPKTNFDGKIIKSISVKLNHQYLMCINCDVSIFNKMQELSSSLLKMNTQPKSLFSNDWQENLHISINAYLQKNNLLFDHLNQNTKKALVKYLFDLGAFNEKNAADYIAKTLTLGRATIFKYLKEWRKQ